MNRFWMFASALTVAGMAVAQEAQEPRQPIVVTQDDRAVASSEEDGERGRFYLNVGVGAMRLHNASSPKPGSALRGVQPHVTLRLGYDFAESPWSLEGFGTYGDNRKAFGATESANNFYGLGMDALYHFDRYATFDPFLAAGLSYFGGSSTPMWQDAQRSHFFAQAGIGALWHLSEHFSLRGDLRYHVGLTDSYISFTTADISMSYYFGGGEESSADTLQPINEGPIEAGAVAYDEQSELSGKLVDVTPTGSVDAMKLELRVQYTKDSALIEPADYPALDELVRIIRAAIAANPEVYVTIDGHADRTHGSDHAYNQRLSEDRAKSVKNYLAQNGIPVEKMKAAGHSFDQPKDPVNLDVGTPSNRRTEVVIRGVDEATREKIRQTK